MANTNAPFGLRPYRHAGGGDIRTEQFTIASAYNSDIYTGDPVEMTGTGQNIQRAAAGNVDNAGVFAGCRYVDAQGKPQWSPYWPANTVATDIEAYIIADPNVQFLIQTDTLTAANVGLLADWSGTGGSAANGISSVVLAASAGATTGQSLRIIQLATEQDNDYGQYAKAVVQFAEHIRLTGAAGAGGV